MSTNRILTLARRVIQQLLADRRTLVLILVVPLVVLTVASVLVRLEPGGVRLAIVQLDTGADLPIGGGNNINLGERLTESLGNLNENIDVELLTANDAQDQLEAGDLDAIITIPADFSARTMQQREITILVEYEGSNPQIARMLEGLLSQAAIRTLASVSVVSSAEDVPPVNLEATYLYGSAEFDSLDYLAPAFIGLFVFMFVFILTSVAFLRERVAGTLERLQATPINQNEIIIGYMLGFALFALVQALIILLYTILGLNVHYMGSLVVVFVVELLLALMAVNLGVFFSTFARNEFQVVQFIPLVVVTQVFLSGAIWAVEDMPGWLQPIAWVMPLTHANYALRDVMIKGANLIDVGGYVLVLIAFIVGLILVAAQTIRRQATA